MLAEDNYSEWVAAIRAYFLFIGFLDYLDGDLDPPDKNNAKIHNKYKEQCPNEAGVIFQSLNTNNHAKFLNKSNDKRPDVLYNSIVVYHKSNQSKNQARGFYKLQAINCKDKELNGFISGIRIQLRHLNSVGIRLGIPTLTTVIDISDELTAEIIVSKLSAGYDNLN
ncbi:hypothetical protein O181_014231 [Austropuccinia psidii MF-1]|uniref:Uncharacterized protein n=1 Tax=Austropuccinia psidii MF-1 TaxID=1389203 RepID=A0A9Q3C1C6_9BASI|nr:hypothetical protein [Austropuccinia psidii MF-1]